jgi:hypothetical protein
MYTNEVHGVYGASVFTNKMYRLRIIIFVSMSPCQTLVKKVPINVFFSSDCRHISIGLQKQKNKKKKQTGQTEEGD